MSEVRGTAASKEIAARDGSRTKVSVLGAPSRAEATMAAAHATLLAKMYVLCMKSP
jgi:hypothetical protein